MFKKNVPVLSVIAQEKDISNFTLPKVRTISIESPRVYVRPPHMRLEEEEE